MKGSPLLRQKPRLNKSTRCHLKVRSWSLMERFWQMKLKHWEIITLRMVTSLLLWSRKQSPSLRNLQPLTSPRMLMLLWMFKLNSLQLWLSNNQHLQLRLSLLLKLNQLNNLPLNSNKLHLKPPRKWFLTSWQFLVRVEKNVLQLLLPPRITPTSLTICLCPE